jgi:hypothetical protein
MAAIAMMQRQAWDPRHVCHHSSLEARMQPAVLQDCAVQQCHFPTASNLSFCWQQKADIWSCGVILYAMLYGCYPFSNKEPDYIRKIVTATYHMPPDVQVLTLLVLLLCCNCSICTQSVPAHLVTYLVALRLGNVQIMLS